MTTQELTQEVVALDAKVAAHDVEIKGACVRLGTVEDAVKEQNRILVVIERLTQGIDHLGNKVTELGEKVDIFGGRLDVIELKPARRWETVTMDIIKLLVAVGVGYLLSQIGIS
jgi:phosphate uptake regulator